MASPRLGLLNRRSTAASRCRRDAPPRLHLRRNLRPRRRHRRRCHRHRHRSPGFQCSRRLPSRTTATLSWTTLRGAGPSRRRATAASTSTLVALIRCRSTATREWAIGRTVGARKRRLGAVSTPKPPLTPIQPPSVMEAQIAPDAGVAAKAAVPPRQRPRPRGLRSYSIAKKTWATGRRGGRTTRSLGVARIRTLAACRIRCALMNLMARSISLADSESQLFGFGAKPPSLRRGCTPVDSWLVF